MNSLEYLRDLYDSKAFGLVLLGMVGLQHRLKRYAQFYSRIGQVHEYLPMTIQTMQSLLAKPGVTQGLFGLPLADESVTTDIVTRCRGNLRLLTQLANQIHRIASINQFESVDKRVVEAAQSFLMVGTND